MENISETNRRIEIKEKQREQLSIVHNYGDCDKISEEITSLMQKRFQLQIELNSLQCKQQQSDWYKRKKSSKKKAGLDNFSDSEGSATCSAGDRSSSFAPPSRSPTPVPVCERKISQSPTPLAIDDTGDVSISPFKNI